MNNHSINLKIQLAKELEKAVKFQRINQELYDKLTGDIFWLLRYAKSQNIVLPNLNKIQKSIDGIHSIMDSADSLIPPYSSPKSEHPNKTPEDGTERNFILFR
jgi:hypothetical protein